MESVIHQIKQILDEKKEWMQTLKNSPKLEVLNISDIKFSNDAISWPSIEDVNQNEEIYLSKIEWNNLNGPPFSFKFHLSNGKCSP